MGIENNGYLDPTQTIINYVIREKGGTFEDLQVHDPNQMLANWRKVRRNAQGTSLACAIAGGLGGFVGVFTMAIPLGVAGISIAILGGYLFKHHGDGAKATQTESDILDRCRTVLTLFLELQRRGADPNVLAGLYDRLIKAAIANRLDVGEPAALKAFFEREIEQSNVVAVLLGKERSMGIASTPQPPQLANTPDTQPIGVNTRLGAVASTAVEVEPDPVDDWCDRSPVDAAPAALVDDPGDNWADSSPVATAAAHPVKYLIGDRLRTSLIVSVSGGGKDMLLSNALREFLSTHPGFKVVVMDCKDDPKETGYYAGLPNVRFHRLRLDGAGDGEVIEWADRCLDEFRRLPEKALLICNEGRSLRSISPRYVKAINSFASSADSFQKYVWEAGDSAHLEDLGISGAARSRLRLIVIGLKGEQQQIRAVLKAQCVDDAARNMRDIEEQLMRSPVGRAWCDGMRWFPMPELENYSGYNRDTRSHIAPTTPKKKTEAETRAALEKSFHGPEIFPDEDGNVPNSGNISGNSGNAENQWEREFPDFEDGGKHFPETEFPLVKAVYLAVKAEMENGKSRTEIVQILLECKGRKYKAGCAWFDALLQKFEPQ